MAVLGVLARVRASQYDAVYRRLSDVDGVTPFSVGEAQRVGILVEAESLSLSHHLLTEHIETMPGVLGVWPVFSHVGSDRPAEAIGCVSQAGCVSQPGEEDVDGNQTS